MSATTTIDCTLCGRDYHEHASLAATPLLYCSMSCEVEHREVNGEDVDELSVRGRATMAFERAHRAETHVAHCADCGHQHETRSDAATACPVCQSPRTAVVTSVTFTHATAA